MRWQGWSVSGLLLNKFFKKLLGSADTEAYIAGPTPSWCVLVSILSFFSPTELSADLCLFSDLDLGFLTCGSPC